MLYLIPSWYQDNRWTEHEQFWYLKRAKSEFDDSVKQMQLFHRNSVTDFKLLILGFMPNFRHFLHRKGVLRAPYWSCFDAICEIKRKKADVFSFHDINWPEGVEFIYSPFLILVYLKGEKYAKIEFGEDGNPIEIDMYDRNVIIRQNIYDDRGFVAQTSVFCEGKLLHTDFLMENGIWKIRMQGENGHVIVNSKYNTYLISNGDEERTESFRALEYERLEDVIGEVFNEFLKNTSADDIFSYAVHSLHSETVVRALRGRKTIASFFEKRVEIKKNAMLEEVVDSADVVICDSENTLTELTELFGNSINKSVYISPYDTRVETGISRTLAVKKILFPVDDCPENIFNQTIIILMRYLEKNTAAEVHLFTRNSDNQAERILMMRVQTIILSVNGQENEQEDWRKELGETAPKPLMERFLIDNCGDEMQVSKCMREQSLVVDMRNSADFFLQILAVSMGVPQVVLSPTQFVVNKKNGLVIHGTEQLLHALEWFLDTFTNWNNAVVWSYEIGKKYSSYEIIKKWKEVLGFFE